MAWGRKDRSSGNGGRDFQAKEMTSQMFHPIDQGWSWVIMLGSFGVHVMSMGYQRSFGVLFVAFQEKFGSSSAMTSAITGAQSLAYCFLTLLVMNYVVKRVSVRTVCVTGALLQFVSVAASSLVPNTAWLIVTEGILFGCGHALLYCPTLLILSQYFERRRPIATSLASCGASVGGIAFPYLTRVLLDTYALQGTLLLLSGMLLQQLIFVLVYTPPSNYKPPDKHLLDSFNQGPFPKVDQHNYSGKKEIHSSQLLSPGIVYAKDCTPNQGMETDSYNASLIKKKMSPLPSLSYISKSHDFIPSSNSNSSNPKYRQVSEDRSITRSHQHLPCESSQTRPGHKRVQNSSRNLDGQSIEQLNASLPCLLLSDIAELSKQFRSNCDNHENKQCDLQKENPQERKLKEFLFAKSGHEDDHPKQDLERNSSNTESDGLIDNLSATNGSSGGLVFCSVPSLMKLPAFWLLVVFFSCGVIGTGNPAVYIPPLAKERGLTDEDGSFFLMTSSLVEMVGRIIPGLILHFNLMRPSVLIIFPLVICGTTYHLTPFFTNFSSILALSLIYGLFSSSFWSLQTLVVIEILGLDRLASSIGYYAIFMGFSAGVSFPVSGALKDASGTYSSTFHFFGVVFYVAAAAIVMLQFINVKDDKKNETEDVEKTDNCEECVQDDENMRLKEDVD